MEVVVIGGGISGLATAFALEGESRRRGLDVHVQVVELEGRLGGKIHSRRKDGFLVEGGPNGWLDSKPSTDELLRTVGAFGERIVSNDAARKRFVLRHGELHRLPESPGAFLTSGLMSFGGKLRIMREPWAAPPPAGDESVADFARRRLGPEALEALLDPMVSGVFAGNPEQMSLASSFPRIAEIERQYGGLVRGMMSIGKERRRARKRGESVAKVGPAPAGRLVSMRGGTEQLVDVVRAALSTAPQTDQRVMSVSAARAGYRLKLASGVDVRADKVVLATPAWASAAMVDVLDSDLARELLAIPYAAVSVVALGWKREHFERSLDGFGFLIPSTEGRRILGTLWDSSVFVGRAPDGYVLTRSIIGGARRPELAMKSPEELVEMTREELRSILGVGSAPDFVDVVRHERAIPQYPPGHAARLLAIAGRLASHPGLYLTGNAYRGVALPECAARASKIAAEVLEG